jgi:hypothetical protein
MTQATQARIPSRSRGALIFTVATAYMLAYAAYLFSSAPMQWGMFTIFAGLIGVFALLIVCGFSWGRILLSITAALASAWMILNGLTILSFYNRPTAEHWKIVGVMAFLPALGYLVCSILLCQPSVRHFAQYIWLPPDVEQSDS